jgi:NAD(P)-dependent dehydrogenase (short-subunit alcohol dehydrogenase family)
VPLQGRIALVTGAGRGIGRSEALALAQLGATVVVNDIDAEPAGLVVDEIGRFGGRARVDTSDVASVAGGRSAVERIVEEFGRIDIVVNNAGFARGGGTAVEPIESEIDSLLDVHFKAPLGTIAAAFADMRTRGWGRIINTVSEASLDPRFVGSIGYGAAKAALWSLTLSAAKEGTAYGITVNAISPGARTRLNADLLDRRFRDGSSAELDLDPRHVAAVVAYLATDDAGDITGRVIHAAGGHIREYSTTRTSQSPLVARLQAAVDPSPSGLERGRR